MLKNKDLSKNVTQERINQMKHVAEEYLENKTNEMVVMSVTDVNTVLKIFKNMFNQLKIEKKEQQAIYDGAYPNGSLSIELAIGSVNSLKV